VAVTTGESPGSQSPGSESPGQGRLRRRRNILIGVVILALMASVGGLLLSTSIKSPAQQAAQTSPPGLTRLTTTVQRQVVTDTVLAQAVVSKPPEISGPPGGGGSAGNGAQPIVTRIFLGPGSAVSPGRPILEVAGRPMFVFQGSYPAYRDLTPGESGPDVAQLQVGLETLGFSIGSDASGVFGAGTSAAVAAFYQDIGYSAPKATIGPKHRQAAMVPLSEFMFVPRFPAHVVSLGAKIGQTASGSLVTLSLGRPGIDGQLNPADAALVRPGMNVRITDPVTGKSRPGKVVSITDRTKTKGSISGGIYLPMKIRPGKPLPSSMVGQNLSLTINAARSSGPVLTVPEAAVFAGADGRTYVSKVTGARSQVKVPVRIGITGSGLVQVTPLQAGALTAGSIVVTGQNYASSGQYAKHGGLPRKGNRITIVGPG